MAAEHVSRNHGGERATEAPGHGSAARDGSGGKPLRADARRNYDLLLAAGEAAFAEHGAAASLGDVARRAGVGIGTLYRHFATREALLAKVLDGRTDEIVARARELMEDPSPIHGLASWLEALVRYVTTYRGLAETVAAGYVTEDEPMCSNCDRITAAGATLVRRAQGAGELKADADPKDVVMAAHAAAWLGEQTGDPTAPLRLLATLLAGLGAPEGSGFTRGGASRGVARSGSSRGGAKPRATKRS